MNDMTFKIASEQDMDQILDLALTVFHGEQSIPRTSIPLPAEKQPKWWCVEQDGRIIACLASWIEDGERHMGRFAVLPQLRGQKIGSAFVRFAFDDVFSGDCDIVYMEARDVTVHILLGMGAEITGETFQFFGRNETPLVMRKEMYLQKRT